MDDDEVQYNFWRWEYAHLLLQAYDAVKQMKLYAPEDANPEWYESRAMWCQQEAEEVWPAEHSWPKGGAEIYDFHTKEKVNS
jgi:hypothetical protein